MGLHLPFPAASVLSAQGEWPQWVWSRLALHCGVGEKDGGTPMSGWKKCGWKVTPPHPPRTQ